MKHYFLGLAANYSMGQIFKHTFAIGRQKDHKKLEHYLIKKYEGEAFLTVNGRSALTIALRAYFSPGDVVLTNGFTCYAVYEAIQKAGLTPAWVDINPDNLNFDLATLKTALKRHPGARGIIVQNSLGHVVNMEEIEQFASKHNLLIIEDLAHSAGMCYPDGRETGTVGAAAVFSFGKDKSIDTVAGGAVVLRRPYKNQFRTPTKKPAFSYVARARFYPLIGLTTRALSYIHLSGPFMRLMLKVHFVEKSADSPLDVQREAPNFVAKLAFSQFEAIDRRLHPQKTAKSAKKRVISSEESVKKRVNSSGKAGETAKNLPLRNFYLVGDRGAVLKDLQDHGYYFGNFWYEKPVSPERYYDKVKFPEKECPVATSVAASIINFPAYYSASQLAPAVQIVKANREDSEDVEVDEDTEGEFMEPERTAA